MLLQGDANLVSHLLVRKQGTQGCLGSLQMLEEIRQTGPVEQMNWKPRILNNTSSNPAFR